MSRDASSEERAEDLETASEDSFVDLARSRLIQLRLWLGLSAGSDEGHSCYFRPDPWTVLNQVVLCHSATSVDAQEMQILDGEIEEIVSVATDENVQDGMESETEVRLGGFVAFRSVPGLRRLSARLASGCMNAGTVADVLRVLGQMEHKATHDERLWIATRLLRSDAPRARDASAVALEDLGDSRAITALEEAASVESVPELKADLEMALRELMKITHGVHSEKA